MKVNFKFVVSCSTLFLSMIFSTSAYAYLDPGSGSMIIQAIIALIAAVGVSMGIFKDRLRSYFNKLFSRKKTGGPESDDH